MLNIPCHGCGAKEGEMHQHGCDMERCPFCGGQLITCGCCYKKLGFNYEGFGSDHPTNGLPERVYKEGLNEEETAQWYKILEDGGRRPWICYPPTCAKCGKQWSNFFMVPDGEWEKYIDPRRRDVILCRECYDTIKEWIDNGGPVPHCCHD